MQKLLFLFLFIATIPAAFSQEELMYEDERLDVFTSLETLSDEKNDRYYDYYNAKLVNTSDESIALTVQFVFTKDSQEFRSDVSPTIQLKAGESIVGDPSSLRYLTLFHKFNVGNSGKKLSNKEYQLTSIVINYL